MHILKLTLLLLAFSLSITLFSPPTEHIDGTKAILFMSKRMAFATTVTIVRQSNWVATIKVITTNLSNMHPQEREDHVINPLRSNERTIELVIKLVYIHSE